MFIEREVIYFSVKLTVSKDNEVLKNVMSALASSAKQNRSKIKCEVISVSMYTCINREWSHFYVSAVSSTQNQAEVKLGPKNQLFFLLLAYIQADMEVIALSLNWHYHEWKQNQNCSLYSLTLASMQSG